MEKYILLMKETGEVNLKYLEQFRERGASFFNVPQQVKYTALTEGV